jgi:SAM-dependent methyltransferase
MIDASDALLAAQYETYPYPARDPADEAKRLVIGSPSHLREIDHWVFGAARSRSRPLTALFAGGGTGDGTIMLAQQMAGAGRPGRIVYLDRSVAASEIAKARAAARGLEIEWLEGSLLELPGSGLGPFDYIDCCGVLHHLPDPAAGLQALLSVLAPGGGLGLMLYAPHGRTGVYELQDALHYLTAEQEKPAARLDTARRVMRHLPDSAWLRRNTLFADHITGGDAGLYDLLLNPRDRAFSVPALHRLLSEAGLAVQCWIEPMRYDPAIYLPDAKLRARIGTLDPVERAALAEAITGNMSTHVVYATRADEAPLPPDGLALGAVPVMREMPGADLARHIRPDGTIPFLFDGLRVPVPLPPLAAAILRLIDGVRTVGDIGAELGNRVGPDAFERAWRDTYTPLCALNRILLAPPA